MGLGAAAPAGKGRRGALPASTATRETEIRVKLLAYEHDHGR